MISSFEAALPKRNMKGVMLIYIQSIYSDAPKENPVT